MRDSGQVEQDADVVLFIYRRDYYDKNDKPGQAEIFTAKNRNGADFNGVLHFNRHTGKFSPLSPLEYHEDEDIEGHELTLSSSIQKHAVILKLNHNNRLLGRFRMINLDKFPDEFGDDLKQLWEIITELKETDSEFSRLTVSPIQPLCIFALCENI